MQGKSKETHLKDWNLTLYVHTKNIKKNVTQG